MRRKDRQVKEFSELVSIISRCHVCTVVLHNQGHPYPIPLNFGYEIVEDKIVLYFHSATEGTKIDIIRRDPKATFEMHTNHHLEYFEDRGYCTMSYESVIGTGSIVFVEDSQEKLKALRKIMNQFHPDDAYFNPAAIPRTRVYKLIVESMHGKSKPPRQTL